MIATAHTWAGMAAIPGAVLSLVGVLWYAANRAAEGEG